MTGRAHRQMIAVTGQALIDPVIDQHGRLGTQAGGGPLNTARTIGRLSLAPAFPGRLSQHGLGRMLRARLDQDGVTLQVPQRADAPTTLAVADVDHPERCGTASTDRYHFGCPEISVAVRSAPERSHRNARWRPDPLP